MKSKINLSQFQAKLPNQEAGHSTKKLETILSDAHAYLNPLGVFIYRFNAVPNIIEHEGIDCERASLWLMKTYEADIKDIHYTQKHIRSIDKFGYDDTFYFLGNDLIVYFDTSASYVKVLFRETDIQQVEVVSRGISKYKKRGHGIPRISLLVNTPHGIETRLVDVVKPKLKLEDNYNDDFLDIHKTIIQRLSKKHDKGLVLLHGKPGTGKTSYIRYLISVIKKNVIFLPPNMAEVITHPNFISILIDNPNSVFVIEDAENIVVDRETNGASPVSALLNIADGLLSDCLNIQIICSFNTDIAKVDSALLRKGRLIAKYEFKELEVDKANRLSKKLGYTSQFFNSTLLTAIYNQHETDFNHKREKGQIGFKSDHSN